MEQVQELPNTTKNKPNTKKRRGGASILCPHCDRPTRVLQTRRKDDGIVRRERLCVSCSVVFDTNEKHLPTAPRPYSVPAWCTVKM
jgi:hypothetical protein